MAGEDLVPVSRPAPSFSVARRGLVALLLAHLLAVLVLAVSPELHHRVHADADAGDHDCAVTLFLHGGGDTAPVPLALPMFVGWEMGVLLVGVPPAVFVPSVFAANRVLEHAPPAVVD